MNMDRKGFKPPEVIKCPHCDGEIALEFWLNVPYPSVSSVIVYPSKKAKSEWHKENPPKRA